MEKLAERLFLTFLSAAVAMLIISLLTFLMGLL